MRDTGTPAESWALLGLAAVISLLAVPVVLLGVPQPAAVAFLGVAFVATTTSIAFHLVNVSKL
jgi:hypothetical protein